MAEIRLEKTGDIGAIRHVHLKAFEGPGESKLVDALRNNGNLLLSMVAVEDGMVVGHVAYSPISVGKPDQPGVRDAAALAPIAVLPEYQGQGVGSELMRLSLTEIGRRGHPVVILLGDPAYYGRFGFVPTADFGIDSPFDVDPKYFMLRSESDAALREMKGTVAYGAEFEGLD